MSDFHRNKPRRETDVRCQCFADPVLFLNWEELPEKAQREFTENGPIPCGGGGVPGIWCARCRFGKTLEPCPFCGSSAFPFYESGIWAVSCSNCDAMGPKASDEATAVSRWNVPECLTKIADAVSSDSRHIDWILSEIQSWQKRLAASRRMIAKLQAENQKLRM